MATTTRLMVATLMNKKYCINSFQMSAKNILALLTSTAIATFLVSCGSGSKLTDNNQFKTANDLTAQGRYAEAYNIYMANKCVASWDSLSLRNATIAASETLHDSIASVWGFLYPSTSDTTKLCALGNSLKRLGRLEERTDLILSNKDIFCHILGSTEVANTEARRYAQTSDDRLVTLYPTLTDNAVKAEVFDTFMKKAQSKLSSKEIETHCIDILKSSPEQKTALRYLGRTRYESAEAKYASAMNDYNKKKSQAAYAYLTRDLKKYVTPLYKESRNYFDRLHKLDPTDKTIVKYLININDRLNNADEVKRLKKLL